MNERVLLPRLTTAAARLRLAAARVTGPARRGGRHGTRRAAGVALALVATPLALAAAPAGPAAAVTTDGSVAITSGRALTWGLKQSWRNYVPRPAVSAGAAVVDEDWGVIGTGYNLTWPLASGSYDDASGTTVLSYGGAVHWTKYKAVSEMNLARPAAYTGADPDPYILDVTFARPIITIGADAATVSVEVQARNQATWNMVDRGRITVATLDISGAAPTVTAAATATTTWPAMRSTATAALADTGLYTAGTVMDGLGLGYDGPGGAPVVTETFAPQGTDALNAAAATLISNNGLAATPTFWWVDQAHNLAHYTYTASGRPVYQAVDLTTGANVGTPLTLAADDTIVPVFWDTKRDRVVYRTRSENTSGAAADRWISYDAATGAYATGTLSGTAFDSRSTAAYDPVGDRAYQINQVKPVDVTAGDYDLYRWQVQTWDFADDGRELGSGRTYTLPNLPDGYNNLSAYATPQSGVGTSAGASYPTTTVLADGSILLLGARQQYVDPGTGAISYPAKQVPGLYRLVLADAASTATATPVVGTEIANASSASAFSQLLTGPNGRVVLVNNSGAVVQALTVGGGGAVADISSQVALPYGAGEVPTAFTASMDQADGTVWFGTRQSQRLEAVRGGRVVSSATYPERSARGGLVVAGAGHTVYSLSTDGLTTGLAAFYSITRFELLGTTATIATQPTAATVTIGKDEDTGSVTFSTTATGRPEVGYQWQLKRAGADRFTNLAGQTSPTATFEATRELDGVSQVRAILATPAGRVATDAVDLTVDSAARLTTAPTDVSVVEGADAVFHLAVDASPEPTVSWQRRVGGFWESIAADDPNFVVSDTALTVPDTNTEQSGSRFRAQVSNRAGTVVSPVATLTVNPRIPAEGVQLTGVTLDWSGSQEIQSVPPAGGSNYLSAGASDGDQASYRAAAGDVAVYQLDASGARTPATYATRTAHLGNGGSQLVELTGGRADLRGDGSGEIDWTGSFSVNFYGGLVPFTVTDPELTIRPDGTGTLSGDLSGYGSSQADPTVRARLEPVPDVTVATFSDVHLDPAGTLTMTPAYAGVQTIVPSGQTPQNRTAAGWGAWPQSWVDFQFETGLSSYWYSSGGQADEKKPPLPVTVDLSHAETVDPTAPSAPTITAQPVSRSVTVGADVALTVGATGDQLGYRWTKRIGSLWVELPDETGTSLHLASVSAEDAGSYRVRVANTAGTVVSSTATLTVTAPPATVVPIAPAKASVTLAVTVKGRPTAAKAGKVALRLTSSTGAVVSGRATLTLTRGKVTKKVAVTVRDGAATVRLPRLVKGTWKLRAAYGATGDFASAATTVKLKVKR